MITKHLRNIFQDGELVEESNVQNLHIAGSDKPVKFYNLDAIISVGYRINSKRGTQFRQWATGVLRDHLMQGWTLDRARFEHNAAELEAALALVRKTAQSSDLIAETGRGVVEIISRYTQTFLLLQRYDEGLLTDPNGTAGGVLPPLNEVRYSIVSLNADLMSRVRPAIFSGLNAAMRSRRFSATLINPYSANLPIRPLNARRRIYCISSSRTTHWPMVTNAPALSCSSIS